MWENHASGNLLFLLLSLCATATRPNIIHFRAPQKIYAVQMHWKTVFVTLKLGDAQSGISHQPDSSYELGIYILYLHLYTIVLQKITRRCSSPFSRIAFASPASSASSPDPWSWSSSSSSFSLEYSELELDVSATIDSWWSRRCCRPSSAVASGSSMSRSTDSMSV